MTDRTNQVADGLVDQALTCRTPPGNVLISNEETWKLPDCPELEIAADELSELLQIPLSEWVSKQERDFVLATLLIRGKHLTERSLREALKRWTPFGTLTLRQFLRQQGMLSDEILARTEQDGERYLQSVESNQSRMQSGLSVARRTSQLLEWLDPSGGVAKLFGLSQIPKTVVGNETRNYRVQFRLLRKLGQGGLGTVWLAVDTSLNRYVAVKEISGRIDAHSMAVARFRREAEITGRLDHPSIVPVHLLGENEQDGRIFYVMRFLGNQTLADAIREYHERRELGQQNPLDFHRLLTAFASICQAIAFAHSNKIIHRDLKPQNVALDNFGQVVVLDWGLAKVLGLDDPQSSVRTGENSQTVDALDVTLAGQVMGTPMYMAPEQAAGRIDEIDERTDVYGLGAILYAILTGYAPHELSHQSQPAGSKVSDLLDMIVDQPPKMPRQLNSQVPPALEAICLKAIAHDRHTRYCSAAALSEDLQRWSANEPISALQDPVSKRFRRWMTKHRRLTQVLALCATFAVTGLVTWGCISYQSAVAAEQLRQQTAVDDIRDIRSKLAHEIETLSGNTRFMAALPTVQALIDARYKSGMESEAVWTERLKVAYSGLIDVNPSYMAVTFWYDDQKPQDRPIRAENLDAQQGREKSDITEFLTRHLPAIASLTRHEVYVGMPGRISQPTTPLPPAFQNEPVGECMVSGVGVYHSATGKKVGGVAIECNLERVLFDHLNLPTAHGCELFLTDQHGRCVMRFTRENGLRPIDPSKFSTSITPLVRPFFEDEDSVPVTAISPTLCAAKVPLSHHHPEHFMGLVLSYPE